MESNDKKNVYKEVWDTLSKVDVNEHTQEKAGLTYLSWAWAWGVLMEHYPEATYEFPEEKTYADGTVSVECIVTIKGWERSMWLPVMDYRNNAVENPNARAISDTKMRCLVKCFAMWGLGHYIYAGEDVPEADPPKPKAEPKPKKAAPKKAKESSSSTNGAGHPVVIATRDLLVAGAKSVEELVKLWSDNSTEYESMDKDVYDAVVAAFSERKNQLKGERKNDDS